MDLLGGVGQMKSLFGILEVLLILVQDRCIIWDERTIGSEIILGTPMELLGDVAEVEARFGPFGDVLILAQDRCIVCIECTTGMEIFLATPDGSPRWCGSNEISFRYIWRYY
jgi:hypothetical protein